MSDHTTDEVHRFTWWRLHLWMALAHLLEQLLAWAMRHADRDLRRLEADKIRSRWSR